MSFWDSDDEDIKAEPSFSRRKVFFVCMGNTCTSAMAALVAKKIIEEQGLPFEADSFGVSALTGLPSWEQAIEACEREGLDLTNHLTCDMEDLVERDKQIERAYAVFCMQQGYVEEILQLLAPEYSNLNVNNVQLLMEGEDIEEPLGENVEYYHKLLLSLIPVVEGHLNRLAEQKEMEEMSQSTRYSVRNTASSAGKRKFTPPDPCQRNKVFFVCRGNTCRSAMAMLVARQIIENKHLPLEADSFGVCAWSGGRSWGEGIQACELEGLDLTTHRSVDKEDVKEYNKQVERACAIFCFENWHLERVFDHVVPKYPNLNKNNVKLLVEGTEIGDPICSDLQHYHELLRSFYPIIDAHLDRLAHQIQRNVLDDTSNSTSYPTWFENFSPEERDKALNILNQDLKLDQLIAKLRSQFGLDENQSMELYKAHSRKIET